MKHIIKTALAIGLVSSSNLVAKSTIGGIVFTNMYISNIENTSQENASTKRLEHDLTKFNMIVPSNSRFRVKWDNEDNANMYLEVGFGSKSKLKLRHGYGKWDINEQWQILAGQTSTPFAPLNPQVSMVHNSGDGFGNANPSRQSQLRFTYKFLNRQGALAIAILDPNSGETYEDGQFESEDKLQNEGAIPRIDIGGVYKKFDIDLFAGGFYSKASFEDYYNDVDVWGGSLGLRTAISNFTFSTEIATGINWGNTKMSEIEIITNYSPDNAKGYVSNSRTAAVYNGSSQSLIDNEVTKAWVDIGYRFAGSTFAGEFHLLAGYDKTEANENSVSQSYTNTMLGVSMPIDIPYIARGFRLRPEFFYFNEEQEDNQRGYATRKEIMGGIQAQFTFRSIIKISFAKESVIKMSSIDTMI